MDERVVTPATSLLLVMAAGMLAGHTLMPARPTASTGQRVAFGAAVLAAGAVAGWRTGRVFRADPPSRPAVGAVVDALIGALAAALLAAIAYAAIHAG